MAIVGQHPSQSMLDLYMQGRVDSSHEQDAIEQHLKSCEECQRAAMAAIPSRLETKLAETASVDNARPERLSEGFDLRQEIGRGGSGIVYRAYQASLDRWVAVKVLHAGTEVGRAGMARFRREALALAHLDHPNVLKIYDCGEQRGVPYLAMELVEGKNLSEHLSGCVLSSLESAQLVCVLADAVAHAHNQGILHRDMKPQNILLQKIEVADHQQSQSFLLPGGIARESLLKEYQPKIADFGLASLRDGSQFHTKTGEIIGTPAYMAPEMFQTQRQQLGPAVDIYGLGMILYECLTGALPFPGSSIAEITAAVLHSDPTPISVLRAQVPKDLQIICMKCLEKDPNRRFRSARELSEELTRFINGEPIRSRSASLIERLRRWVRRNPWRSAALTGFALGFIAIPVAVGYHIHRLRIDRQEAIQNYESARESLLQMLARAAEPREVMIPQLTELNLEQARDARVFFWQLSRDERNPRAKFDLARVDLIIGSLNISLGRVEKGREYLQEARSLGEELLKYQPFAKDGREVIAESFNKEAVSWMVIDNDKSIQLQREAKSIYQILAEEHPRDRLHQEQLAWSMHNLGSSLFHRGNFDEAFQELSDSVVIRNRLDDGTKESVSIVRGAAGTYTNLALIHATRGNNEQAEQCYRQAIDRLNRVRANLPNPAHIAMEWSSTLLNLATLLGNTDRIDEAIELCSKPIDELKERIAADHNLTGYSENLFKLLATRAQLYGTKSMWKEANADWQEAAQTDWEQSWREWASLQCRLTWAYLGDVTNACRGLESLDLDALPSDQFLLVADIYATSAHSLEATSNSNQHVESDKVLALRSRAAELMQTYKQRENVSDIHSLPINQPAWSFLLGTQDGR